MQQNEKPRKTPRMANLELLRCIAMMMVIVLHYLDKGGMLSALDAEKVGGMELAAWLLESFCIVSVNVYMFISGYFMCSSSFKLSRLLQLWLQVLFYSIVIGMLGGLPQLNGKSFYDDTYTMLIIFFPILKGHYWFMTAYVFLYLMLPFVGMALRQMTKQQMRLAVGLLLFVFCGIKSVLPIPVEMTGHGYDCLWYLCVFVSAAYMRRFGVPFLEKKWRGILMYVGCGLLIFAGMFAVRAFFLRTGRLQTQIKVFLEYNHILPFLAAVGLFSAFRRLRLEGKFAKIVNWVAPHTLGVYLLHENLSVRYFWQNRLGAGGLVEKKLGSVGVSHAIVSLFVWTAGAVCVVFICGILVDVVRERLFGIFHTIAMKTGAYRKLVERVKKTDELFCQRRTPSEDLGCAASGDGKEGMVE